jgi:hypothetical protein
MAPNQIRSRSSLIPKNASFKFSATARLRHHGIRGAKHGYSRSHWARNLLETTQDTLNHDTVDANAVPGISTDIAYNQEHNSFFLRPLDTEFSNSFHGQKDFDGWVKMSWAGEKVTNHNQKIGQSTD